MDTSAYLLGAPIQGLPGISIDKTSEKVAKAKLHLESILGSKRDVKYVLNTVNTYLLRKSGYMVFSSKMLDGNSPINSLSANVSELAKWHERSRREMTDAFFSDNKPFDTATKSDVLAMSSAEYSRYVVWALGDARSMSALVQVLFPNSDPEAILGNNAATTEGADGLGLSDIAENKQEENPSSDDLGVSDGLSSSTSVATTYHSSDKIDFRSRMGTLSKNLVAAIVPLKNTVGQLYTEDTQAPLFDPQHVEELLVRVCRGLSLDATSSHAFAISRIKDRLNDLVKKSPKSSDGRIARAILYRFVGSGLANNGREATGEMSALAFIFEATDKLRNDKALTPQQRKNLQGRIDAAEESLVNLLRPFMELTSVPRIKGVHRTYDFAGDTYHSTRYQSFDADPEKTIASELVDSLRSVFTINDQAKLVIDSEIRGMWAVGSKLDTMTAPLLVSDRKVVYRDSAGPLHVLNLPERDGGGSLSMAVRSAWEVSVGKERPVQEDGKALPTKEEAAMIVSRAADGLVTIAAGAGVAISKAYALSQIERSCAPASRGQVPGDIILVNVLGRWSMAMQSAIAKSEPDYAEDVYGKWLPQDKSGIVREDAETLSDGKMHGTAKKSEATSFILPSSFFKLNQELTASMTAFDGLSNVRKMRNANGEIINPTSFGSALTSIFGNSKDPSVFHHQLENARLTLERDMPWLKFGDKNLNLFLNPALRGNIAGMAMFIGIESKSDSGGSSSMIGIEDRFLAWFDMFSKSVLRKDAMVMMVPAGSFGARDNDPVFLVHGSFLDGHDGARLLSADKKKSHSIVRFNEHLLFPVIVDLFKRMDSQVSQSSARWHTFFGHGAISTMDEGLIAKLGERITSSGLSVAEVMSSGLIENVDYVVKNGKVLPGNVISAFTGASNPDIYNKANRATILAAENGSLEQRLKAIWSVYGKYMDEQYEVLSSIAPHMAGEKVSGMSEDSARNLSDAFFLLSHIFSENLSDITIGPEALFPGKNVIEKRIVGPLSPGSAPLVSSAIHRGVGYNMRVATFADPEKEYDGSAYFTPFGYTRQRNSFGGLGGPFKMGIVKGGYHGPELMVKAAQLTATHEVYWNDSTYRQLFLRSLVLPDGDTSLLDKWNEVLGTDMGKAAYDRAVNGVWSLAEEKKVDGFLVDMIASSTSVKKGMSNVNFLNSGEPGKDEPLRSIARNSGFFRVNRFTTKSMSGDDIRVAYPKQWSSLVALSGATQADVNELRRLESRLINLGTSNFIKDVNSSGKKTFRDNAEAWFVRQGMSISISRSMANHVLNMLSSLGENGLHNPMVHEPITSFLASMVSKSLFLPNAYGREHTQYSAEGWSVLNADGSSHKLRSPRLEVGADGKLHYIAGECVLPDRIPRSFGIRDMNMTVEQMRADIDKRLGRDVALDFDKATLVFAVRGPSISASSGQWLKAVRFTSTLANAIGVTKGFNDITGGDNDGDALMVIYRHAPTPFDELSEADKIQERILDTLTNIYSNNEHPELLVEPVGTKHIENIAEVTEAKRMERLYGDEAPCLHGRRIIRNTPIGNTISRQDAADGELLVAIAANQQRLYGNLIEALHTLEDSERAGEKGVLEAVFRDWLPAETTTDGARVLSEIRQVVNGMLDNPGKNVIKRIGVNKFNLPVVMGMVMTGIPLRRAVEIINIKEIQDVFTRALGGSVMFAQDESEPANRSIVDGVVSAIIRTKATKGVNNIISPKEETALLAASKLATTSRTLIPILGLTTKGIPHNDAGRDNLFSSICSVVDNADLCALLADHGLAPLHKDIYNHARSTQSEEPLNTGALIAHLPVVLEGLRGFLAFSSVADAVFMHRAEPIRLIQNSLSKDQFNRFAFPDGKQETWITLVNKMAASWHLSNSPSMRSFNVGDGGEVLDLSTIAGQYHLSMRVPKLVRGVLSGIALAKESERRSSSEVLSAYLSARMNGVPRVFLKNPTKLYNDPIVQDRLASDMERFDKLSAPHMQGGIKISDVLFAYSLVADSFGGGRDSLRSIFPAEMSRDFNASVRLMSESLHGEGRTLPINDKFAAPSINDLQSLMWQAYGNLAGEQLKTYENKPYYSKMYRTGKRANGPDIDLFGGDGMLIVSKADDASNFSGYRWMPPNTTQFVFDGSSPMLSQWRSLPRIQSVEYAKLMEGEPLERGTAVPLKEGYEFVSPEGRAVRVSSVSNETGLQRGTVKDVFGTVQISEDGKDPAVAST